MGLFVYKICFVSHTKTSVSAKADNCVWLNWHWVFPILQVKKPWPPGDPGPVEIHGLRPEETRDLFTLGTIASLAAELGPIGAEIGAAVDVQMRTMNAKLGDNARIVKHVPGAPDGHEAS